MPHADLLLHDLCAGVYCQGAFAVAGVQADGTAQRSAAEHSTALQHALWALASIQASMAQNPMLESIM